MPKIFVSYRRQDTVGTAGRLYDRLTDRFGREQVYRDIDAAVAGDDFVQTITNQIQKCDVLLALIGPGWLKTTDETGGWRLAQEDDLVRLEISTALERNIRVIPVLLQGATMPRAADLPLALSKLAHRNAVEIRDEHFDQDVSQLLEALSPRWYHRRWIRSLGRPLVWGGVAAVLAMVGIAAAYLSQIVLTPQQARARLVQLNIDYSPEAFVKAASEKDAQAIELFLKAGIDPNVRNGRGHTALSWAARNGQLEVMEALIEKGADPNPAVSWAAVNGQIDALDLLARRKLTQKSLDESLLGASRTRNPAMVRRLLDLGADVNAENNDTALMLAAERTDVETVKLLLSRGSDSKRARTDQWNRGWTALHSVCRGSVGRESDKDVAIDIAKTLLEKGAVLDARAMYTNSSEGWTPLLVALENKRWELARFLIGHGADVNAVSAGHKSDERHGVGLTALMLAARGGDVDTIVALLAKGADVGARTGAGNEAISFAAENASVPVVEALLANGASINTLNEDGLTPLMLAAEEGRADVALMLIEKGADVRSRTKGGHTALSLASRGRSPKVVDALLAAGVDVNAVTEKGWTALMVAAYMGRSENARLLVAKGARLDLKNNADETALDIARKEKSEGVVDVLLAASKASGTRQARPQ